VPRLVSWLWQNLERVVFAAGLATLIFTAGMLAGHARLFPFPVVNAAWDAAVDLEENWRHYLGIRSEYALATSRSEGGVITYDRHAAFDGYTFIAAYGAGRLPGFNAYLLDMDGRVVHEWDGSVRRIWPDPGKIAAIGWDGSVDIHGVHLFDNGDVVLNIGALGTVKLDRCSRVLWTVERPTHHHVEPLPDGTLLLPSTIFRTSRPTDQPFVGVGPSGFYMDDTILRLDAAGRPLDERSVIEILLHGGWASALISGPGSRKAFAEQDPMHVNDIEVLTPELAASFPMFAAGDVMISVRQLNTIFVADPKDWRIKWLMTGPFVGQHDPDFMANGHIMVYDNRLTGETPRLGMSRLLEIDPLSRQIVWSFTGNDEQQFYAKARGEHQELPNGNILFVDPYGGRLIEIAPRAGNRTVWEWVNLVAPGFMGLVTNAHRVPRAVLPWVGEACDEPAVAMLRAP
jgi:hypothetical protein